LIGSRLCDALLAEGANVLCVDSYLTGRAAQLLGWEPEIELQQGLESTAQWFAEEKASASGWRGVGAKPVSEAEQRLVAAAE